MTKQVTLRQAGGSVSATLPKDMADRLRRSGVDYAQGFHIGVPRPVTETFSQV